MRSIQKKQLPVTWDLRGWFLELAIFRGYVKLPGGRSFFLPTKKWRDLLVGLDENYAWTGIPTIHGARID